MEEHCREMQIETLSNDRHELKKSWSEFFVAISICNTVVVVDSMKSVDSAGSNYNQAFDDSTLSAIDLDHSLDNSDSCRKASTKVTNGDLNFTTNLEPSNSSEPFVTYRNRKAYGNLETPQHTQNLVNGAVKRVNNSWSCRASASTPKLGELNEKPKYEAESPDEEALVKGAYYFGYVLTGRFPESVRLRLPSNSEANYELLHTLGFDSSRKRMSVIVRNPDGQIQLFCKGADTVIMSRLHSYSGMHYFVSKYLDPVYTISGLFAPDMFSYRIGPPFTRRR